MGLKVLFCLSFVLLGIASTTGSHLDTTINELSVQYSALSKYDIQRLQDYEVDFGKHGIWGNVKEKILSAWNNLLESAGQTQQNISEWFKNAKVRANEVLTEAKENIRKKTAEVKEKLKEIEVKAKEVGVDIKECLVENEDAIATVIAQSVTQLTSCITNKVGDAEGVVSGVKNVIEIAANVTNLVRNKLDECKKESISRPRCLSAISVQIVKEVTAITKQIVKTSTKIKNIVNELKTAVIACAAENALDISIRFTKLVLQVGTCVKQKMDQANQIDSPQIYLLS